MKVALVYDRLNKWGGAERVLLALHQIFPNAPLYTSIRDKEKTAWADVFDVKTSFLDNGLFSKRSEAFLAPLMPVAFESFSFDEYDLVISVTSEAAKGIITKPKTKHLCICLTPTRYLWSGYEDYFNSSLKKALGKPLVSYLRSWDKAVSARPDSYIAISNEVKERIKKYYQRDSVVIFPPVMIEKPGKIKSTKEKYFLFVSRMSRYNQYKKADLVIEAFNKTGQNLKVVGKGPLLPKLKDNAQENIIFLGEVTDEELAFYYKNSQALIFAGHEDFGLVMAEALSFGTPVIAYRQGGAKDIVEEGKTGMFFEKQTSLSLIGALEKFKASSYNKAVIEDYSKRFSFETFKTQLLSHIDSL